MKTTTITEHLSDLTERLVGPKIDVKNPEALARFRVLDEALLKARLALADAEAAIYGADRGHLRTLAAATHERTANARRGGPAIP